MRNQSWTLLATLACFLVTKPVSAGGIDCLVDCGTAGGGTLVANVDECAAFCNVACGSQLLRSCRFSGSDVGVCCDNTYPGSCEATTESGCDVGGKVKFLELEFCKDSPCDVNDPPIPAVSEWGLIVMTLLVLTVGTIKFGALRFRKAT